MYKQPITQVMANKLLTLRIMNYVLIGRVELFILIGMIVCIVLHSLHPVASLLF